MSGPEMLQEIERRDYYDQKLAEHTEMLACVCYAMAVGFIGGCLLSIVGHLVELWQTFEAGF